MGGASTGSGGTGGGTVGPAGVKVDKKGNKKYGTALDAKLTSDRFENNNNNNGNDNNNTITEVTETAPTVAEVDEATTDTTPTETAETTEANKKLKIKKKGRSASIMTSAKGVTKTSADYSLGKKSLLGNV